LFERHGAGPDQTFLLEMVADRRLSLPVGLLELDLCFSVFQFAACLRAKGIVRSEHRGHFPKPRGFPQPIEFHQGAGQLGGN
jgi:hypothetical protein